MATLSTAEFFGALALLTVAAHLGGFAATRARLPSVVGELAAGVALAAIPSAFIRGLRNDALIDATAELGVMLLMFDIGLELRTSDLRRVGGAAFRVASIGVVASLALVGLASRALGASIGISGRVLREFGKTQRAEGRTELAAAALDDVISLLLLAFVSALVGSDTSPESHGTKVVLELPIAQA